MRSTSVAPHVLCRWAAATQGPSGQMDGGLRGTARGVMMLQAQADDSFISTRSLNIEG